MTNLFMFSMIVLMVGIIATVLMEMSFMVPIVVEGVIFFVLIFVIDIVVSCGFGTFLMFLLFAKFSTLCLLFAFVMFTIMIGFVIFRAFLSAFVVIMAVMVLFGMMSLQKRNIKKFSCKYINYGGSRIFKKICSSFA